MFSSITEGEFIIKKKIDLLQKKFFIFLRWFRGFYSLGKKVGVTCLIRQQNIERIFKAIPW